MKKNIVVAGTILADVVKVVETYPEKGMLAPFGPGILQDELERF